MNSFPARRVSTSLSSRSRVSPNSLPPDRNDRNIESVFAAANGLRSPSQSPQRPGSHTASGRVRHDSICLDPMMSDPWLKRTKRLTKSQTHFFQVWIGEGFKNIVAASDSY